MTEPKQYHLMFYSLGSYCKQDTVHSTSASNAVEDWTAMNGFIFGVDEIHVRCERGPTFKFQVEM